MTNGNGNVAKNEICKQRYDINRPRPIDGPKYTKYKMCPSIMMVICIKQLLSNILVQLRKKLRNTEAELKQVLVIKKEILLWFL